MTGDLIGTGGSAERAVTEFRSGLYCSEAVLKVFNDRHGLGLPPRAAPHRDRLRGGTRRVEVPVRVADGRGDGAQPRTRPDRRPRSPRAECFAAVSELHDRFKDAFRATCCRALTRPVEWGSDEHHAYCERFVREATTIAEEILLRSRQGQQAAAAAGR